MATLTNIVIEPCTVTWDDADLGYTDGDIEVTLRLDSVDITAHQTGTTILDAIRTGAGVEDITITLKETSVGQLETILAASGSTNTPSEGTEVLGWGENKRFSGMLSDAKKLVFHPVAKASNALDRDLAFWKTLLIPGSITRSAENPLMISVSFKVFPDTAKISGLEYMVVGDHTQTLDAS